jgi:16S rRNA (uracil1498-N3)-methyltransferase
VHVLRVQSGVKVLLFNEKDGEWSCVIEGISKTLIKLRVNQQLRVPSAIPETHLYFAPLRKERLMDVLEKGTELGVTHFHPIFTEHTVNNKLNIDKLEIYIQDAAEQCGRCDMPQLFSPVALSSVLSTWDQKVPLFLALEGERLPPLQVANATNPVHIAVGPEGGWSDGEKEEFHSLRFVQLFSLGGLTLRAETAVISSLALVNYLRYGVKTV